MSNDDPKESEEKKQSVHYSDPVTEEEYDGIAKRGQALENALNKGRHNPKELGARTHGWMKYSAMGFQMIGALLLPILLGIWLDSEYGSSPFGVLVGSLLGIGLALYAAIKPLLVDEKKRNEKKRSEKNSAKNASE